VPPTRSSALLAILSTGVALAACGGGGGKDSASAAATSAPTQAPASTATAPPATTPEATATAAASTATPTAAASATAVPTTAPPAPASTPTGKAGTGGASDPLEDDDATSGTLTITASDFAFSAKKITAKAGKLTVAMENAGGVTHTFAVVKTNAAVDALPVSNGQVNASGSAGEVTAKSASVQKGSITLSKGRYVFYCSVPGHYEKGMRGELVVS
jgi:uncharacterized cupredoxin-like copper-binding protein